MKPPHFPARAKRVIFLFMHGGPSQMDTFDYKPLLKRDHGKPSALCPPESSLERNVQPAAITVGFRQYGQSGAWVSDLFPGNSEMRGRYLLHQIHARFELASWRSAARTPYRIDTFIRPSMGSWITYGLGTENSSMPGFRDHLPDAVARRRQ